MHITRRINIPEKMYSGMLMGIAKVSYFGKRKAKGEIKDITDSVIWVSKMMIIDLNEDVVDLWL